MSEDQPKTKPTLLERIRSWWWQRQFKRAQRALTVMVERKDPEIYHQIHDIAEIMARQMCMRWLDNKGIHHCAKCPNTEQLIAMNGAYLCIGHARKAGATITAPTKEGPKLSVVKG